MIKEFKTQNTGKTVIINTASMKEVLYLQSLIENEIKQNPIGLKLLGHTESIFDKEIDFTSVLDFIKNVLIGVDTNESIRDAIFECLKHCTYDKVHKITFEMFDEIEEARADYYEIVFACIEENLRPFIKSLISQLKTQAEKLGKNQLLNTILGIVKQ